MGAQILLGGSVGVAGSVFVLGNSSVAFASDANHALLASEYSAYFLLCTSSVSLTATRNLVAPLNPGQTFLVANYTTGGQVIQVIGPSGTGVTIPNGQASLVGTDGVNYFSIGGAGTGMTTPVSTSQTLASPSYNATYGVTTSSSSITFTVTGIPVDGVALTFVDVSQNWPTHNLIFAAQSGATVRNPENVAGTDSSSISVGDVAGESFTLKWFAGANKWLPI
jgi:hypothetical protein